MEYSNDQSSLSAWRNFAIMEIQNATKKDFDQTAHMSVGMFLTLRLVILSQSRDATFLGLDISMVCTARVKLNILTQRAPI